MRLGTKAGKAVFLWDGARGKMAHLDIGKARPGDDALLAWIVGAVLLAIATLGFFMVQRAHAHSPETLFLQGDMERR